MNATPVSAKDLFGLILNELPCEIQYLQRTQLSQRGCATFVSLKILLSYSRWCEI